MTEMYLIGPRHIPVTCTVIIRIRDPRWSLIRDLERYAQRNEIWSHLQIGVGGVFGSHSPLPQPRSIIGVLHAMQRVEFGETRCDVVLDPILLDTHKFSIVVETEMKER